HGWRAFWPCLKARPGGRCRGCREVPETEERRLTGLRNVTFEEIEVGNTVSVSRPVTETEVGAMALVSGDADPWHLDVGAREAQGPTTAQAVGAEALVSTVLNRRLPGPVRSAAIAPDNTDSRGRVVFERLIADIRKFTAGHRSHHAFAASVAHLA